MTRGFGPDELTGLHGRAHLLAHMSEAAKSQPVAVALADLRSTMCLNDFFGYAVVDEILRRVGIQLDHAARQLPGGTAYRAGGDEFAFVWRTSRELVEQDLKQVLAQVDTTWPIQPGRAISRRGAGWLRQFGTRLSQDANGQYFLSTRPVVPAQHHPVEIEDENELFPLAGILLHLPSAAVVFSRHAAPVTVLDLLYQVIGFQVCTAAAD